MKMMVETNILDDGLTNPDLVEVACEVPVSDVDDQVDHMVAVLDGYGSMLTKEEIEYASLTGNEAYAYSVLQLHGFSGSESWVDTMKQSAETAYKAIIETLRTIKEFFFGDGKKAVEEADKKAVESLESLAKLDMNAPIKEESKLTNPLTYFKNPGESVELENLYAKYPAVKEALEKVQGATSRIANAKAVGQLGAVYQEMRKKASEASGAITKALESALKSAEDAANEMKAGPKAQEDATNEIKQAAKEQQKENVDTAKEETRYSKALGSLRNKITTMLNAISNNANSVKGETKESEFKG